MNKTSKQIKGYEGLYSVSPSGDVISHPKHTHKTRDIILKQKVLPTMHRQVMLSKKGVIRFWYVHTLVANAYIDNPLGLSVVKHVDGNKSNNDVKNLRWSDLKGNIYDN